MILLDTCALIFDALFPEKLSAAAKKAINTADKNNQLFCCDISLWEIAMLVQKGRLDPRYEVSSFLKDMLNARDTQVLAISIEIATISTSYANWNHFDPADRLIAATAICHNAGLITCDKKLSDIPDLSVIW